MSKPWVASITRYPVKGLPGVVADGPVSLAPGRGVRWDRSHAIENGRVRVGDPAAWNARSAYFHVARHDDIVRFGVRLDDAEGDSPVLSVTSPHGHSATSPLVTATDEDSAVSELLRSALPSGPLGGPRLIRTGVTALWDWPEAHLSIINLETLRALSEASGTEIDPRRFRGNLLIDGLPAWEEFALLGRRARIGDAVVEFFQPTDRCRATTIDPDTGASDLNVPALLASRFGHMYCGVYARVVSGGSARAGDRLVPADDDASSTSLRPSLVGETEWPRVGRIVSREPAGARTVSLWIDDPAGLLGSARPGQHLRVHLPGEDTPSWRAYTISGVDGQRARITVRRDGRLSTALHERIAPGIGVVVTGPFGDVTLDAVRERDIVLVSAGSGITPTVAMLRSLRASPTRPSRVRVLHSERTGADLALWDEVTSACAVLPDASARLHLTRAASADLAPGALAGRPTASDVLGVLDGLDTGAVDVFVCGPALFAADVRETLANAGVPVDRIHAEVFYSPATAELSAPRPASTTGPHRITAGTTEALWRRESGTILDAVEGTGTAWPSGCRTGACGTCVRRLVRGDVEYLVDPLVPPATGSVLVCCSAPTSDVEFAPTP